MSGRSNLMMAATSVNPVLGTRSWSMSITKDTQETTTQGDTFKSFIGGLIEGEGSAELVYDNAASRRNCNIC